jgi:magnesium transporter
MSPTLSEYPGPALPIADLRDAWLVLSKSDRADGFRILKRSDAEDFFLGLSAGDMAELLHALPEKERRVWVRLLAPDDAADLLQSAPTEDRDKLIACLDDPTRKEVTALMAYAEDEAGGLMNPRFARVRPDMTVDEAVSYLRRQARETLETIYYVYVADEQQHLLGVVSFRELFIAKSDKRVRDVMATQLVTVGEEVHQEEVGRLFAENGLMAIPVVDVEGRIKGIVTVDDIVDVVREEATEDAQKFGGMEALE